MYELMYEQSSFDGVVQVAAWSDRKPLLYAGVWLEDTQRHSLPPDPRQWSGSDLAVKKPKLYYVNRMMHATCCQTDEGEMWSLTHRDDIYILNPCGIAVTVNDWMSSV